MYEKKELPGEPNLALFSGKAKWTDRAFATWLAGTLPAVPAICVDSHLAHHNGTDCVGFHVRDVIHLLFVGKTVPAFDTPLNSGIQKLCVSSQKKKNQGFDSVKIYLIVL